MEHRIVDHLIEHTHTQIIFKIYNLQSRNPEDVSGDDKLYLNLCQERWQEGHQPI